MRDERFLHPGVGTITKPVNERGYTPGLEGAYQWVSERVDDRRHFDGVKHRRIRLRGSDECDELCQKCVDGLVLFDLRGHVQLLVQKREQHELYTYIL